MALKTLHQTEKADGENCFSAIKTLGEAGVYQNILCVMSDTTYLNTVVRKGICSRVKIDLNKNYGDDTLCLECSYHCF